MEYLTKDVAQLKIFDNTTAVTIHPQKPMIVPSHVFFGLIIVSGVLPNAWRYKIDVIISGQNKQACKIYTNREIAKCKNRWQMEEKTSCKIRNLITLPPRKAKVSSALMLLTAIKVATRPTVQWAWPPRSTDHFAPNPNKENLVTSNKHIDNRKERERDAGKNIVQKLAFINT